MRQFDNSNLTMMENLNKNNFWDALRDEYPEAVAHFCKWVDAYKAEVGWVYLFGEKIKFHDVPYEFQLGILTRYELELYNNKGAGSMDLEQGRQKYEQIGEEYKVQLRNLFRDLQGSFDKRAAKLN